MDGGHPEKPNGDLEGEICVSKKPKIRYTKRDPLKARDPWEKLRKKPGVTIKSTARNR